MIGLVLVLAATVATVNRIVEIIETEPAVGKSGQAEAFAGAKLLPVFIIHKLLKGANGPLKIITIVYF
ncbi:MAG: hypothetical protein QM368_06485 [Bacillota bacterium]|jgi:hypothetical protein|nr:hypothetical protein [Bacillota bacterium]HHU30872.1 hypothetical protein [Bacillota bacterium]